MHYLIPQTKHPIKGLFASHVLNFRINSFHLTNQTKKVKSEKVMHYTIPQTKHPIKVSFDLMC